MNKFDILLMSDSNGHDSDDPQCVHITVHSEANPELFMKSMHKLEMTQLGAQRAGGHVDKLIEDLSNLGIKCEEHNKYYKRKSTFDPSFVETVWQYKLISGNY